MQHSFTKLGKQTFILVVLVLICASAAGQLVINEFSASNSTIIEDIDFNDYADWIEIYNSAPATLNLKGYFITDNLNLPEKWQITSNVYIAAGGYLLIWADGRNTGRHASFKLSASGEEIGLYSPDLSLLDSVIFAEQRTDVSYGRVTDGNADWGFFQQATPNASNSTSSYSDYTNNVPEFSVRGGFYSSTFSVELSTDLGGEIRYTSDGSEPDPDSELYAAPIPVSSTTILRARIFKPDMLPGPTFTQSYFINENSVDGKLPVVSIATSRENFWDSLNGIYVQDFKPLWEVPVNIELFENNGSDRAAFNELAGAKINGLWSWKLPQKMLGIYFRKQYGSNNLDYPVLHQRKRTGYKSFALRASGSDWSYTLIRDMLGQHSTILNMDLDIMSYRPAVVYVNGEYLGIHNIREKVDDDYIEKSYNIEPGSFDLIENNGIPEAGDLEAFNHLLLTLNKDLSVSPYYNSLSAIADIENVTDYMIAEMAIGNTSIDHNVMVWKPKDSGKWKWVLMDVDRGFFRPGSNLINFYLERDHLWLNKLFENQSYKTYFARRLAAQLYTSYNPERMNQLIDEHMHDIEAEIPRHVNRWYGTTSSYGDALPSEQYWRDEINDIRTFVKERPSTLLNDLSSYGFSGIANLGISTIPEKAGVITIDGLIIPGSNCNGPYVKDLDIQLVAENKPGFEFVGWSKAFKQVIVATGSEWKYLDSGEDPGSDWTDISYNDDTWKSGAAQLGYGDGDENTVVSYGGDSQNKFITTYFRKTISISEEIMDANRYTFKLLKDDGAIVYLNGVEIARANMASGEINYQTLAASAIWGSSESVFVTYTLDGKLFQEGQNILAVEIHQGAINSSDISFDFELSAYLPDYESYVSINQKYSLSLTDDLHLVALYDQTGDCLIPEIISEDVTFNRDCSPYLAQGDITINENVTLTIEPGVEIWMPEDANILVKGAVNVIGTPQSGILIRLNPDYGEGTWGALSFRNTDQPSSLKYLTIEDASQGPDPVLDIAAVSAFHADLKMENVVLENISGNPISARYSDITLTNSSLHSTITGDLINVKYGNARIENCLFVGNDQPDTDAIDYDEIENGVIRNSQIVNFMGLNNDAVDIGEKATNILIDSIFVYNVTDKGVSIGQRSSASIQNSIFINCNMGIGVKDSGLAIINHCLFYGNVNAVKSFEKNLGHAGGNARISNSILANSSNASFYVDSQSTLEINYSLSDNNPQPVPLSNLDGNPLFANPTFFDFELLPESPGIQAGYENGQSVDMGSQLTSSDFEPSVMLYQFFINAGNLNLPEFIGLYNPSAQELDLSNYSITKGITATIPDGTFLESEDVLYLTDDASARGWMSQTKQVLEWESGKLSNNGEAIQLEESHGIVIDFLEYENNELWPNDGFSNKGVFQLISPGLDNHYPESWTVDSIGHIVHTSRSFDSGMLTIFPNPASDVITIMGIDYKQHDVEIYNLNGRMIGKTQLDENGITTIDLSIYDSGVFLIRIDDMVRKVVLIEK